MLRDILVVILAVVLSALLFSLAGFIEVRFTDLGAAAVEMGAKGKDGVPREPERVFPLLEAFQVRSRFLYRPAIAILVGSFVGLFAQRARRRLTIIALLPLVTLAWDQESWDAIGIGLSLLYLGIGLAGAEGMIRWRRRRAGTTTGSGTTSSLASEAKTG
jgi:hypothetical protein